jgi:hypothetical protein
VTAEKPERCGKFAKLLYKLPSQKICLIDVEQQPAAPTSPWARDGAQKDEMSHGERDWNESGR